MTPEHFEEMDPPGEASWSNEVTARRHSPLELEFELFMAAVKDLALFPAAGAGPHNVASGSECRGDGGGKWAWLFGAPGDAAPAPRGPGAVPPEVLPPSDCGRSDVLPLPPGTWSPAIIEDAEWAEQNRKINDLLMGRANA